MAIKVLLVTLVVTAVLLCYESHYVAGDSCGSVFNSLRPCMPNVMRNSPPPAPASACCTAVKKIAAAKQAQQACGCLKGIAAQYPNVDMARAKSIPAACHVQMSLSC